MSEVRREGAVDRENSEERKEGVGVEKEEGRREL
jgi:hypothetical protein